MEACVERRSGEFQSNGHAADMAQAARLGRRPYPHKNHKGRKKRRKADLKFGHYRRSTARLPLTVKTKMRSQIHYPHSRAF